MAAPEELPLSLNLTRQTLLHLDFLQEIQTNPHLIKPEVLKYVLWRYETKWLPLVAKTPDVELEPPIDIHWIWYVHMMSPRTYREDCKRLFNAVPDHKFRRKFEQESAQKIAKSFWDEWYEKDSEPFYLDYNNPPRIAEVMGFFTSKLKGNLYTAAVRLRGFFYHVALPHFRDARFLELATDRYKRFVALLRSNPDTVLVPMYDVDLIWRTHLLNVESYKTDTEAFVGLLLNYKDYNVFPNQNGTDYSKAVRETFIMWEDNYDEQFPKPGTLFRKDAPFDRMHALTNEELDTICFKCFNYEVAYVKLKFLNENPAISIGGRILVHDSSQKRRLPVKNKPPYEWNTSLPVIHVDTYSNIDTQLEIALHTSKYFCWRAGELGSCIVMPLHAIGDTDPTQLEGQVLEIEEDTGNDVTVQVGMRVSHVERERLTLRVSAGEFWQTATLQEWEVKWGLAGSGRIARPSGIEHECYVAEHRLLNFKGEQAFLVRVIHSRQLRMSAVHVLQRSRMVAVAHLLSKDDLPRSSQLMPTSHAPCLDPRRLERALVVRGAKGDWGVVKGRWSSERVQPLPDFTADPGHLQATYYNLTAVSSEKRDIMALSSTSELRVGGVSASVIEESITVHAGHPDIPEHLALMFSTLVLVALCKPAGDDDALTLLRAAGQEIPTPNNRFIYGPRSVSESESDRFHDNISDMDASSNQESARSEFAESEVDVDAFWPAGSEETHSAVNKQDGDSQASFAASRHKQEAEVDLEVKPEPEPEVEPDVTPVVEPEDQPKPPEDIGTAEPGK